MASSAGLACLMFLAAPQLANLLGAGDATSVVRVMAVSVLFIGVFAVPNAVLARDFRQRAVFGANLVSLVASNSVLLGLALAGAGPMAFAWSVVAGHVAGGVIITRLAGRWYAPRLEKQAAAALIRFGAPLAAANLLNYAYLNIDYVIVGRLRGATALGTYLLAFNIASWPYAALGASINSVSMPAFSDAPRPSVLQHRIEVTVQTVAALSFPLAGILTVLAHPLVETVYGSTWTGSAGVLPLLAPYGALFVVLLVLGNALTGNGRSGTLLALQAVWLVTLVPVMVAMVGSMGPRGAATAHLAIGFLVALPVYLFAVQRTLQVDARGVVSAMAAPLALAVSSSLVAWAATMTVDAAPAKVLVGGLSGGALYALAASPLLLARLGGRMRPVAALIGPLDRLAGRIVGRKAADRYFLTTSERRPEGFRPEAAETAVTVSADSRGGT
jgi:PST family polysaccharide transporter